MSLPIPESKFDRARTSLVRLMPHTGTLVRGGLSTGDFQVPGVTDPTPAAIVTSGLRARISPLGTTDRENVDRLGLSATVALTFPHGAPIRVDDLYTPETGTTYRITYVPRGDYKVQLRTLAVEVQA